MAALKEDDAMAASDPKRILGKHRYCNQAMFCATLMFLRDRLKVGQVPPRILLDHEFDIDIVNPARSG